ncbi:hypothetical protein CSAL01_01698 [Colletotrichum salicis]|uniref:Uncharacterized protein n=1 Tax=Colletotrichum salicis TaxID=1209931 RepID=A0A135V5C0_9PEZI|nr:hypothetical protein CSAL01_01698 [Colletotrichum salicis]
MEQPMTVDQGTQNSVSEETRDVSLQCQDVEKCQHPPFPKPCSQFLLPPTSWDTPPCFPLSVGVYGATSLLKLTCQNFYACEPRPQQVAARLEFVQIFLEAMAGSTAWGGLIPEELEEFEQNRCSDTKLDSLARKLEGSLHEMLLCLDDFFFFGALTRHPHKPAHSNDETSKYSHLHLMTGFGILKGEVTDCFAESRPRYNSDRWFAEICLYPKIGDPKIPGSEVERISFVENVASLIHEMVHAYIQMPQWLRSNIHEAT